MSEGATAPMRVPASIGALRDAHLALMREWRGIDDPIAKAARAEALREDVRLAGCDIANPGERDEAQGILDYWASAVAALPEQAYPASLTLDVYKGDAGARAFGDARKVFLSFRSEDEKRVAQALFEDLLNKGPNGIERCGARTRAALQQRLRGKNVDAVLAAFEASGAIARRPGATPEEDLFEATDANLVTTWPELDKWLSVREDYERKRDILLGRAQQWEASDRSSAYLARGEDLREIDRFSDETKTLDDFIKASKRNARKYVSLAVTAVVLVAAVFVFLGYQWWQKSTAEGKALRAEAATAHAEADKLRADARVREYQRDFNAVRANTPNAETVVTAADAPPNSVVDLPRLDLAALAGAVWLGNDERPQVAAPTWRGVATQPSRASEGTAYRVLADINLRQAMPPLGSAYVSRPQKAVVRAGTLLILTGKTQAYDRPTGPQYWAPVQVVPRVFIQYSNVDKAAVERLRKQLGEAGFDVPAAERVAAAKGKREVRYFDDEDRAAATLLLTRLGAVTGKPFGCQSFVGSRASNRFALEVWLDGAAARSAAPAACAQDTP